jgi:lysozyme family protein
VRFFFVVVALGFSLVVLEAVERADDLRVQRWLGCNVPSRYVPKVDVVVRRILLHKGRYQKVADESGVPWVVIAAIHNMESSGSFREHLHCGGTLKARTRWVPKGRPLIGEPPFSWEFSAKDALSYDGMGAKRWGYLFDFLWAVECYNGTGYWRYHRGTPTQYLYAATNQERPGKYVSDGKWSSTARSKQIGCAAVWRRLEAKKAVCLRGLR